MRAAGESPDGLRLRALIMLLWRAGLRVDLPIPRRPLRGRLD
jgi:hypothetical protein